MIQQAELHKKIDTLPPKYFGEVFDFVEYLQHKAQVGKFKPSIVDDAELFEKYADELNAEAEDVLSYQNMYFEEIDK